MLDTREKLAELLKTLPQVNHAQAALEGLDYVFRCAADYLIANGVTFGKPLTEYLHPVDAYEGLKGKYLVFKADTGEQVVNCFVLRPDKDTAAVEALRAYAHTTDNKTLANDIYNWVGKGVTVQQWIPVTERLPEERDSLFTSFYGTAKWQDGMFLKVSDTVLASVEYEDGKRRVKAIVTKDGKWDLSKMYRASKVTHWMPLPEPPKGE